MDTRSTTQTDDDLISSIGQLLLPSRGFLVTAESCTGGGIAQAITAVPGVSAWFYGGFVTYSNEAKMNLLNVEGQALQSHGAVSPVVVEQMALGALNSTGARIAVSVSGIAGPGGGTPQKPVGTVWIGWATAEACSSEHFLFSCSREDIRQATIKAALQGVLQRLQQSPPAEN